MRLSKLKKQIAKSKLWQSVDQAFKDAIPDEEKVFLEVVSDILKFPASDLIQMWAFTSPEDRVGIRESMQNMMDDKIAGTLHEGHKDKEWYRKIGLQKAAEILADEQREIDLKNGAACQYCQGTGGLDGKVCIRCGGTGKLAEKKAV